MKNRPFLGVRTSDRTLMKQAANLLAADLSLSELFDELTRMLAGHVDSSVVFIALARPDGTHSIEYFYDHGEIKRYPHIELREPSRAIEVMRTGEIIWGNHVEEWAPPEGSRPIHVDQPWTDDTVSAIFVPMRVGGTTVGALSVQSPRANAYDHNDVETIAAIAHYLAIAIQNHRMYQTLQRNAEHDPLTKLSSYSRLRQELDSALASATSTRPFVAVMFNIVNFGMFNETYGYAEGDEVLRRVAHALRECEDADELVTVGRFGSDVFMLLLRDAAPDAIAHVINELSKRLAQLAYVARDLTLPISLACGYVVAPIDAGSRSDLIALCVARTRLSRKRGCVPMGTEKIDPYVLHGNFAGIETIVDGLLDRDPYMRVHLLQVNSMAKHWSEYNLELDRDALAKFLQASLLHDVGTLLVSNRILMRPGRLGREEFEAAQCHAAYGRNVLAQQFGYEEVAEIVGQHHERVDGLGYPQGLVAGEIHPLARAIAILDAFSAMVANRPYHRGITEDAAVVELQRCAGSQFDSQLVDRFVAWREEGSPPPLV
ncbi:MAG: HD domain-containing phosphohydrolase [Candidatus Baltobacteraceae bacterium]